MTDLERRRQAAKDACRDAIVSQLVELGVTKEHALGVVLTHVHFNASLQDPISVLAFFGDSRFLDDAQGHGEVARLLAHEHLGMPLSGTRLVSTATTAKHVHHVASTF